MARLSITDSTGYQGFVDAEANFVDLYSQVAAIVAGNVTWSYTDKTTNYTIVIDTDTYGTQVFTNDGASATVTYNLPAGAGGARIPFCVMAPYTLKVSANGSETIRYKGTQTAGGGYLQSDSVGDYLLIEWNGTEWIVAGLVGSWAHASGSITAGSDPLQAEAFIY